MPLPLKMHDSSIPPSKPLAGFSACAGYIGGDTPHTWTRAEWARFKGFPKLPIYVNDGIGGQRSDGERDANQALIRLYDIGCPPGHAVAYDIEARIVPKRVQAFTDMLTFFGYAVWLYGSASTVFKNPAQNYWVAHYGLTNPAWPSRNTRAFQVEANVPVPGEPNIDISWIRYWQIKTRKLWI